MSTPESGGVRAALVEAIVSCYVCGVEMSESGARQWTKDEETEYSCGTDACVYLMGQEGWKS